MTDGDAPSKRGNVGLAIRGLARSTMVDYSRVRV